MKHLSNDHKDCPNHHENSHKLCNETGHLVVSIMESQLKLIQQHEQNFRMEGTIIEQILASEEINLKGQDCENHSLKPK